MSVLVTGATGFIGREVVRDLLDAGRAVTVLARRSGGRSAFERVSAAVGGGPADSAVRVVEGDLAMRDCGLTRADWGWLCAVVDTVIHCAGDPRFEPDVMEEYVAGHVAGPVRLLERLAAGRLARWAQVSTAFVCGRRSGAILEHESDLGQAFNNSYERVKLDAELAVRAAGVRCGVDVRVFRPGIVVGTAPATAGGRPSNLLFTFIRALAALARRDSVRLRIAASPRARFNIVPVAYVAAAVVDLAERAEASGTMVHLVAREAPTQAAMLRAIAERVGLHGVSLVEPHSDALDRPSRVERAVARMLAPYRPYLTQDVRFDDTTAAQLLAGRAVERPRLSREALHALIDQALIADTALDASVPVAS
jgi:thioester reductase-like protein